MRPQAERVQACRVLVVGDVMLDRYWHGDVSRISPEAPVPVVRVAREECRPGGAANVARNARQLGAQVTLLSVVGHDEAGRQLQAQLADDGVCTQLEADAQMPTLVKLRVIGRHQQMLRLDFEQAPGPSSLQAMRGHYQRLLAAHDVVVLSDYAKGALSEVTQLIALARAAGKPVLVDPKGRHYQRYHGASVLTPNTAEFALESGDWHSEAQLQAQALAMVHALQLQALLLTRSELGMTLFTHDAQVVHDAAQAREVADVTGAGDTVLATLAVLWASGMELVDAMRWANRAAGRVVARFGTSALSLSELLA